jgi:hypothetical protein
VHELGNHVFSIQSSIYTLPERKGRLDIGAAKRAFLQSYSYTSGQVAIASTGQRIGKAINHQSKGASNDSVGSLPVRKRKG